MATPTSPFANASPFDNYYREFAALLRQLEDPNKEKTNDRDLQKQCADLLSLMSLEARSTDCPDRKMERLERVKIYKFQFEAVRNQHDKEFLMGGRATEMLAVKERLERVESRAAQQNELLERARRSLAETEEVGANVMSELHGNRQTIESAQGRVGELNNMTTQATKIIKNMSKPWYLRWTNRR